MRVKFNKEIPFCVVPTCEYDQDIYADFVEFEPQFVYALGKKKTLFLEDYSLYVNGKEVQEISIDAHLNDEEVLRLIHLQLAESDVSPVMGDAILAQIKQYRQDRKLLSDIGADTEVLRYAGWDNDPIGMPTWCYIPD